MKDARREGQRWLAQAERDLEAARHSSAGGFHDWACYQAQQAAEKAFKGFLYARGEQPGRSHSVSDLGRRCTQLEPDLATIANSASLLDSFYIVTRYPNALPSGTPAAAYYGKDSQEALTLAGEVLKAVKRHWRA